MSLSNRIEVLHFLAFVYHYYAIMPVPTLANQDDLVIPSQALVENSQDVSFIKLYFDATNSHILNKYNFNSRFSVHIINQYIILVWDPGISFTMYYFIHILRFPIYP